MSTSGGQPGNNNPGKNKPWADAIRRVLAREDNRAALERLAADLLKKAQEGDQWAMTEIANRLDGKPVQRTEISGPDGDALSFQDAGDVRRKLAAGLAAMEAGSAPSDPE